MLGIEVTSDGLSMFTHLEASEDFLITRITDIVPDLTIKAQALVSLPDAGSAMEFQDQLLSIENLGPFNNVTNSCISHVCDVLMAGGITNAPDAVGSAQARYIMSILIGEGRL
jgi:hypothetical protein